MKKAVCIAALALLLAACEEKPAPEVVPQSGSGDGSSFIPSLQVGDKWKVKVSCLQPVAVDCLEDRGTAREWATITQYEVVEEKRTKGGLRVYVIHAKDAEHPMCDSAEVWIRKDTFTLVKWYPISEDGKKYDAHHNTPTDSSYSSTLDDGLATMLTRDLWIEFPAFVDLTGGITQLEPGPDSPDGGKSGRAVTQVTKFSENGNVMEFTVTARYWNKTQNKLYFKWEKGRKWWSRSEKWEIDEHGEEVKHSRRTATLMEFRSPQKTTAQAAQEREALLRAAESGKPMELARLLAKGHTTAETDRHGNSLLHLAAQGQNLEMVRFLLGRGADANARNRDDMTALHMAASYHNAEMATLLLENGADPDVQDKWGMTPLHRVVQSCVTVELLELLLRKGASASFPDGRGDTPLHLAAERGQARAVVMLVAAGAEIDAKGQYGRTPLHLAAERGAKEVVRFLLEKSADPNTQDDSGITPLHCAASENHREIAMLLLDANSVVNPVDSVSRTPLDMTQDKKTRSLLLAHGAVSGEELKRGKDE